MRLEDVAAAISSKRRLRILAWLKEPRSHFPAQLDGVVVSDSENFVLEPFLQLATADQQPFQVIAAGSSFAGLEGAHRIELTTVWT